TIPRLLSIGEESISLVGNREYKHYSYIDMSAIKIVNGDVITSQRIIKNGSVLIVDGKIAEVSEGNIECSNATIIDARGKYISLGSIDIDIHDEGGHDFMDGMVEDCLNIGA